MSGQLHNKICENTLMSKPTVAIIGLGLIGASFAAALKESRASGEIIGCDTNKESMKYCLKQGYIDRAASLSDAAATADIVILATPISTLGVIARNIAPVLREGSVVSDVASVKQAAIAAIAPHLPEYVDFVPAHPIAGRSVSGATAADNTLFNGKLVILSPDKGTTSDRAIAAIARLWEAVGSQPERMADRNHDILYGYVSHLPQMMAYAACTALAGETYPEHIPSSFSAFIRLGSSDPKLWAEIATANMDSLSHAIAHVLATIDHMKNEFSDGERKGVESKDSPQVAVRYFPLLASAALISVINQFEEQNSIQLASYAGTGFRDFTAPAAQDPNDDMGAISDCYAHVARCLGKFHRALLDIHNALSDPTVASQKHLLELLSQAQTHHKELAGKITVSA
ncbi:MAG: prephenate dehydrogenase/arogenate dehydrogenase family protein [Alphaproteobacteria bacterium]|nr:prephenate dehydrogenase/arogenate dehydrogenase family protein [Alphaproteobacteria bacterium]